MCSQRAGWWRRLVWNPVAVKLSHCFLPRGAFKVVFEQHGFLLENREARKGGVYSAAQSTLIQNALGIVYKDVLYTYIAMFQNDARQIT